MLTDYRNRTFAEIAVGETASTSRALTATDVEALALASGDVEPLHIAAVDGASTERTAVQGAASVALLAGLLSRRLPGPGSAIVSTRLNYAGSVRVGDTLTATVTARSKDQATRSIEFECRCVNQMDEVLVDGMATVTASDERIAYNDLATPELILRRNDGFAKLFQACRGLLPATCAIVHPCDRDSLLGSIEAAKLGLIVPVLVGPEAKIRAVAAAEHVDLAPYRIVATEHSHAAAEKAVAMVRSGEVESLMKGSLHTDELMGAIVATESGLRTDKRISHVFVMDVPAYPRLLLVTDAAVNIAPDLECKAGICQNAIALAHVLGIAEPKVAILSAVETVTPKIPSTVDAAALCKMADRGQISGGVIEGPLAFDNAISEEAAKVKGIVSPVAGRADILLVPDLESGNILAKQLQYLAGAESAGIVLGARAPIALTSRADSVRSRLASAALLKLVARRMRGEPAKSPT